MSSLSVLKDGVFVTCTNPIFPTSSFDLKEGTTFTFEVFEADAASLKARLQTTEKYYLEGRPPFFGKLISLEPCQSTHPGVRLFQNKPTLCGVFSIMASTIRPT
jgi:hypothetical protein